MKFYLIDDDKNIRNILKLIIRDRNLGEVCGISENASDALEDLPEVNPDIVIVDLLMPEMDGITFVKCAHKIMPDTAFIMLSQVASKDMIANAYAAGVEFYIQKPINSIEVEAVIQKVISSLNAKRTLQKVQSIFMMQSPAAPASSSAMEEGEKPYITKLQSILQTLGISGEKGSQDIVSLVEYLVEQQKDIRDMTLSELCSTVDDNPKSAEQRIRRAALTGMSNLASMGLEDYSNEIFTSYAGTLYNFEQVRREMNYIRGKSMRHGNVKIKSFLSALILRCTEA